MLTRQTSNHKWRSADRAGIEPARFASSVDVFAFQLQMNDARETRIESARTRAKSRALRAKAAEIVEQSQAPAIKFRAS